MKKRGQFKILVYVIISVVMVFALIFGYKAVKNIGEKSREAMLMDFKNNFLADIAPLKYEDVVEKTYSFPDDVKTVCFVDYEAIENKISLPIKYPLVKNSVESRTRKNVFLLDNKGDIINSFYTAFKTQNKVDDPEHYCAPVINGKATLLFGGKEGGLKGIAEEFEKLGTIKGGTLEFKSGEMTLKVTDNGANENSYINFQITKKSGFDPTVITDEYNIQFDCNDKGKNCDSDPDYIPSGIQLELTIDYPSCSPDKTYTLQGSGVFGNKELKPGCIGEKLIGIIP